MKMKIVIALGGNALIKRNEKETYENLLKNIKKTCSKINNIIKNNKTVITFGNGPEVGNLLLQNEIARKQVPMMPLHVLDAETEGLIGYMLQEELINKLRKNTATIITQVLVSKKDKAFQNPTKFIGPFYTKKEAKKLENKFIIKKDSNRGYRRVVPSPKPIRIIESNIINELVNKNYIVIAAGGGGVPVVLKNKKLIGVECVVDKDLSSSVLGKEIRADLLLILTDVDRVYLNYGKQNKKALRRLSVEEAKKYLREGQFPGGSMGPKIEAAINFLEIGGKRVIITSIENAEKALNGKAGTLIKK
ncbi:carbamate kinase [Candidatus Woesearchaeota archaeon]|nr:carbamate kinase [Candidatus Woesearchaeota archaeon]